MRRCLQLAEMSAGYTAPNPLVGAVLVHYDRIIGEGRHEYYGGPHAEVNCFRDVKKEDECLIPESVLYVSLEPCAHYGKTPPCADLIIQKGVKKVVVGIRDPFEQVNGRGIEKLQAAGVQVMIDFLKEECLEQNRRFFCFYTQHRPYIILKWAQTADSFIGKKNERVFISNQHTNQLVHKWRAEESAILVGTQTALTDDPSLTVRNWSGISPVRILIDRKLKLPIHFKLYNDEVPTIILNEMESSISGNTEKIKIDFADIQNSIFQICREKKLLSLFIEGGAHTILQWIDNGTWDEARVITNTKMNLKEGVEAPNLKDFQLKEELTILSDRIQIYTNQK